MKTRLPILLLLSALMFISSTGELSAANTKPIDCISITNFYPRAPDDVTYYSFGNPIELFYGYMPYFRGFIPPGTIILDLVIIENGKQMAVARHKIPPTGLPQFPPTGYIPDNRYELSEFEEKDQWTIEQESFLYITHDSFYPILDVSRAGWLYVKVGGGGFSPNYSTQFSVRVDTKIYNAWWDKYIKNAANWKTLVEDVETYVDPTSTHVLSVTPTIQTVSKDAGTTTFGVSNTGTGAMPWSATVTSGGTWLSIKSGSGGSNSGTITCAFTANTDKGAVERTGIIQVKADGETIDVKVTQTTTDTALNVTPTNQNVAKEKGTTTFSVSNTGTGEMPWTAAVTSGGTWLSIKSGSSGTGTGTITCNFTANTSQSAIKGTIRVTAPGATGSPVDVTVTQAPGSKTPDIPTADPSEGEFSSSPAQVKVTSIKANEIYYTLTSSKDGSLPAGNPPNPLPASDPLTSPFEGKLVTKTTETGDTGTVDLPIPPAGLKTMYKVKFQGRNDYGNGDVSDVLQYTVYGPNGKTIKQDDAKTKGENYSNLIRRPDGLLDPKQKFLIPDVKLDLSEYSVQDLVLEYLKKSFSDITIELREFKSGIVMVVKDTSWRGIIYPLIVGKVEGSSKSDSMNLTSSGNIEIIAKNILITLNMAGASEGQLTQMMVNDGLNLEYGSDHMVVISSDSNQDFKLVYRYQFGAVEPTPLLSGDDCAVVKNDDGTYKVTYGDGTTQNLIPGVIDAGVLIGLMGDDGIKTEISPITGDVNTYKDGTKWMGLPNYEFSLQPHKDTGYTLADDKIVFYSTTGTQVIKKKP
jgi:hypothetical protein